MNDDENVQIKSTVLEALGKRKAMFMPMVCVSSFMLVGYAALDTEAPEILTDTLELDINQEIDPNQISIVDNLEERAAITVNIDQSGFDSSREGTYIVPVTAADSFSNQSTKDLTVIVRDTKAPVISINASSDVHHSDGNVLQLRYNSDGDIRNYISAIDDNVNSGNYGDVTAFIQQDTYLDTTVLGPQFVNVSVADDAGNEAFQSIPVYIIDDVAPQLELKDNGEARINYGETFDLTQFAKAIDEYEGNITDQIEVTGSAPDTYSMGSTATLTLAVQDSSGNRSEQQLNITVADTEAPVITFTENNFSVKMSDTPLNVADYVTVTDNYDLDITSKVTYSSPTIDLTTEGEKTVTVSAIDASGNQTTKTFSVMVYDPAEFVGNSVTQTAMGRIGLPYVYGAAGPYAFDCSGLVQWVYAQAGVSVPRTVTAQYSACTEMVGSIGDLLPGDLIFFSTDSYCSHVGIYVGNGMMVHAGTEATGVQYTSLNDYWYGAFVAGGRFY